MSAPVASPLEYPWKPAGANTAVDAAALEGWVEDGLRRHRAAIDRLLAAEGPRTLEQTLRAYDDAVAELSAVGSLTGLMHSVYPEKAVRGYGTGTVTNHLAGRGGAVAASRRLSGSGEDRCERGGCGYEALSRPHPAPVSPRRRR